MTFPPSVTLSGQFGKDLPGKTDEPIREEHDDGHQNHSINHKVHTAVGLKGQAGYLGEGGQNHGSKKWP